MLAFTILGLPAHPLIVHGAVVGVPLSVLATLAYVLKPAWRDAYWKLEAATIAITWVFVFLAGMTGGQLEHAMKHSKLIEDHAHWADRLSLSVHIYTGAALIFIILDRLVRSSRTVPSWAELLRRIAAPIAVVAAVAAFVLVGVVGHLGARAAWHDSPAASKHEQNLTQ